jgi:two-component system, NtrC family, response regulator GlrR
MEETLMKTDLPHSAVSLGFGITCQPKKSKRAAAPDVPSGARKPLVLVVDDDPAMRRLTATRLSMANYTVETADSAQMALDACVRLRPNLVISDLRMPGMDGLGLLKELKSRWPLLTVILMTGHGTIPEAVQATQCGAFGFLVKPVAKEEFLSQVQRATAVSTFNLKEGGGRANIVSRSRLMEDRMAIAAQAAGSDAPVVLTGENGTGKELVARAIHAASARRGHPFVVVSCQTTEEMLLETELFGASIAASSTTTPLPGGAFTQANGGTLLLHEIADLSPRLQRVLAKRLHNGSKPAVVRANRSDVRLICTTSHDLKDLVTRGVFLEELYCEVNILPIQIPELGRRREDIPLLVSHFLEQATEPGSHKKIYSREAMELLVAQEWPGNVRQLFDLVKQNVAVSRDMVMNKEFVQKSFTGDTANIPTYEEAQGQFARNYLTANLRQTAGNVSQAARLAKRNRTDFYKLLARYRLNPEDFKATVPKD